MRLPLLDTGGRAGPDLDLDLDLEGLSLNRVCVDSRFRFKRV